ncbi:type II secretion system protein N [Massilia horti]|uniref:Uncharacterized protein n=1 Tax=Massilia horti TaxID=2562153 RepID=A0A4Y9SVM6_9BURK|nr:type II secretion system protein N [Massilia horti]TFW30525.1 hypothetical protein E4O92_16560 [Massilia horti]TFW30556.1 hypothetical protein E4O92_16725 [Massilia horti]
MKHWPFCVCIALCAVVKASPLAWGAAMDGVRAPARSHTIELKGMLAAGRASLALLSVDHAPARLFAIHAQVAGGVSVVAVTADDVTLSDGRVLRPVASPRQVAEETGEDRLPVARVQVTTRAPDLRGGRVEQIHVSQVE